MRNILILIVSLVGAFLFASSSVYAQENTWNGVPMKAHHFKVMGEKETCKTCHETEVPTERPNDKTCIACHGTMDKIPTKANKFDKFPHDSDHYGNTLECTACHAEHKPSRDICSNCHIVDFPNLK